MEVKLIGRLESAVTRLESILSSRSLAGAGDAALSGDDATADSSIVAFDDQYARLIASLMNNIVKPDPAGLVIFLLPLNEVISKAGSMTEGKRSDFFNHLKAAADSLSALAWIAFTGKGCGMSMPMAHVDESWQMAEFYSNKVLVEYRNKDSNHVEWIKALKEIYLPGLRDYVKNYYPLGPVWSPTGQTIAPSKAPIPCAPAPPNPPPASLFSSESSQASSSKPKDGMFAVFQQISSGDVTVGLRKVTDDMKTKNRADRTGIVGSCTSEKKKPSSFKSNFQSKSSKV